MQHTGEVNDTACLAHYRGTVHLQELETSWLPASVAIYGCVAFLGTVGNVLVLAVFWLSCDKSLRTLVITLSFVDLFICSVIIPIDCYRVYTVYITPPSTNSVHYMDLFVISVRNTSFVVEITLLVLIAIDRYYATTRPTDDVISPNRIICIILVVTLFALLLELSIAMVHIFKADDCSIKVTISVYMHYFYAIGSLISMIIIGLLYSRLMCLVRSLEIRRSLRRSKVVRRTRSGRSSRGAMLKDDIPKNHCRWRNTTLVSSHNSVTAPGKTRTRQVAVMLAASAVLFYLTLAPTVLINLNLIPDSPLHRSYFFNCAANFFLYALFSPKFRVDLRRVAQRMWLTVTHVNFTHLLCPCWNSKGKTSIPLRDEANHNCDEIRDLAIPSIGMNCNLISRRESSLWSVIHKTKDNKGDLYDHLLEQITSL